MNRIITVFTAAFILLFVANVSKPRLLEGILTNWLSFMRWNNGKIVLLRQIACF